MTIPVARIAHVSWWRRVLARFQLVHWPSEHADLNELAEERVRLALNRQLAELIEHVHVRDSHIAALQAQVQSLGGDPLQFRCYRRPLPTFIPGPGLRVSK